MRGCTEKWIVWTKILQLLANMEFWAGSQPLHRCNSSTPHCLLYLGLLWAEHYREALEKGNSPAFKEPLAQDLWIRSEGACQNLPLPWTVRINWHRGSASCKLGVVLRLWGSSQHGLGSSQCGLASLGILLAQNHSTVKSIHLGE